MNTNWAKKNWWALAILSIVFVGLMTLIFQSLPFYDIHNFDLSQIKEIKISDRGLIGNGQKEIKDGETVEKFAYLLKVAAKIKQSNANLKINQGLCDVELVYKNNSTKAITIVKTINGGIA
jgi:hypothetical protein